jgi:hypothetical protein
LLLVGSLAALSPAQDHKWFISGFSGQSIIAFGSADPRTANALGIGYSFGRKAWLRKGHDRGELIGEAYYYFSQSNGVKKTPPNSTSAYGALLYSRYRWRSTNAPDAFLDIGWGLQEASATTRDLSSRFNSTPMLDLGFVLDRDRAFVGARFVHISNANTVNNNRGQNQIFFFIQAPF